MDNWREKSHELLKLIRLIWIGRKEKQLILAHWISPSSSVLWFIIPKEHQIMMFMTPIGGFLRILNTIVGRATTTYAANITTTSRFQIWIAHEWGFQWVQGNKKETPSLYLIHLIVVESSLNFLSGLGGTEVWWGSD